MSISLSSYSAPYPSMPVENKALKGSPSASSASSSVDALKTQTADIHNTLVVTINEQDTLNKAQWLKPADTTAASKQSALDLTKAAAAAAAAKTAWDKAATLKNADYPKIIAAWEKAQTTAIAAWESGNRDSSWNDSAATAAAIAAAAKAALSANKKHNIALDANQEATKVAAADTMAAANALFDDTETAARISAVWSTLADTWEMACNCVIEEMHSIKAIPNSDAMQKACANLANSISLAAVSARNAAATVAPAVSPDEIANAKAWKKRIVKILNKNYGKSTSKAQEIVDRIPTHAPGGLENIYQNLRLIRADNGQHYNTLKERMSWYDDNLIFLTVMSSIMLFLPLIAYGLPVTKGTTSEQRLMLRALMLFRLSGIDHSLQEKNYSQYQAHISNAIHTTWRIREMNIQELRDDLSQTEPQDWDVNNSAKFMTFPTIISELQKLITD